MPRAGFCAVCMMSETLVRARRGGKIGRDPGVVYVRGRAVMVRRRKWGVSRLTSGSTSSMCVSEWQPVDAA